MKTYNSFLNRKEVMDIGFASIGDNVLISKNASFYSADQMHIGNNVRIDDFCILSGEITIGSNIHISAYCALYGAYGIELMDYSGMSPRSIIFSASDDFSGDSLIGPHIPKEFQKIIGGKVILSKYCQLGAASIVLPKCTLNEGSVTGAMTLVINDLEPWMIYSGSPAKALKKRSKKLLRFIK
jgi:galactoside O-acetyltransferase